jgi:hypothetical protein
MFQSTGKFLPGTRWVLGFLLFVTDKFGDRSLHEPESPEVAESGTNHVPPIRVRVSLIIDGQLGHGSNILGEAESYPSGDKANHHKISYPATTDPICPSSSESDSVCDREVHMVGQGE